MVEKGIEKKVKVNNFFDLFNVPVDSWVEINGNNEFSISYDNLNGAATLCVEGDYVCKNYYDPFLSSLTPVYIEKFFKGTVEGRKYLKMMEKGDNK